jgi:replicative DNA helicase
MLIFREDMYKVDDQPSDSDGVAEIIIAKQRNGPTGTVKLAFIREQTRFGNLAASSYPAD